MGTTKSYIGITGFTSPGEVSNVLSKLPATMQIPLVIGVCMTFKTLRGEQPKQTHRYPPREHVANILCEDARTLNVVHYETPIQKGFDVQLNALHKFGGAHLHGIQLNPPWPLPDILRQYREEYPLMKVILRADIRMLFEYTPEQLALKTSTYSDPAGREYADLADHVLLDFNAGKDTYTLMSARAREYINNVRARNPHIGIGIAGGLSPVALKVIQPIIQGIPDIGLSAEEKLRPQAGDRLDADLAVAFLQSAQKLLS